MRKLPKRYAGLLIGALMAVIMGAIMSFVVTWINLGFGEDFWQRWFVAFAFGSLPLGLPIAMLVTPGVKHLVDRITE